MVVSSHHILNTSVRLCHRPRPKVGFPIRVARWPGTKDAKFFLKSCQKLPNRFFLTMTSQNSHACELRPEVSYSCPRIKIDSVDRDIKNHFSIAK